MTTTKDTWVEDYFPVNIDDEKKKELGKLRSKFAELGDYVETTLKDERRKSIVRTKLEEAAMWAVASLTKG